LLAGFNFCAVQGQQDRGDCSTLTTHSILLPDPIVDSAIAVVLHGEFLLNGRLSAPAARSGPARPLSPSSSMAIGTRRRIRAASDMPFPSGTLDDGLLTASIARDDSVPPKRGPL